MTSNRPLRIISWNVNGIRAAERKGFLQWLAKTRADIVGLQETRIDEAALPAHLRAPKGYSSAWTFAKKKGYSGVATFTRTPAKGVRVGLGIQRFDDEARVLEVELDRFLLFNVYFPKGSGNARDNSRVPFKLDFYDAFFDHAKARGRASKKPLVVLGDFNTAHQPIDLANPKTNTKTSGFLPEERASLERHLRRGFVDSYRHLHPQRVQYTWWSQRFGVRERNIGWRIDYVWISESLAPYLKAAFIHDQVRGSDHCPLGIDLVLSAQPRDATARG